jgi:hypothetical protein
MADRDVTKEKWVFVQHDENSEYFGNIIANRGTTPSGNRVIRTISVQLKRGTEAENLAYANLMAAAPELLAALKGLISDLEMRAIKGVVDCSDGIYTTACEVIAKAEGV